MDQLGQFILATPVFLAGILGVVAWIACGRGEGVLHIAAVYAGDDADAEGAENAKGFRTGWTEGIFRALELTWLFASDTVSSLLMLPYEGVVARITVPPGVEQRGRGGSRRQLVYILVPYAVHGMLLMVIALVVMHIQVSTRVLAANPALALALAWVWTYGWHSGQSRAERTWTKWAIATWIVGYTALGTALFSNFHNWT